MTDFDMEDAVRKLDTDGFTFLPQAITSAACTDVANKLMNLLTNGGSAIASGTGRVVGGRNLIEHWDGWRSVLSHPFVESFVRRVVGDAAGMVRILYFDKPPGKGWSLAVHKDRTIAVSEHVEKLDPFSKPTRKAGVPHVEATDELLKEMLTLRLHLDPMHTANGPLIVYPGSHVNNPESSSDSGQPETISCDAGDIFVMRPLLSHGSRATEPNATDHRRVIHMELAPCSELPGDCTWSHFIPLLTSAGS